LPVVLLVEDDHGVRRPLQKFLELNQFTVVSAETADEAMDAIREHRPHAAIVDLRLARGSGRDVVISMPAGTPVKLAPGGYHVMLFDLKKPLVAGEKVPLLGLNYHCIAPILLPARFRDYALARLIKAAHLLPVCQN